MGHLIKVTQPSPAHEGLVFPQLKLNIMWICVAFHQYSENLENFCNVALNTDDMGYKNPWFVVPGIDIQLACDSSIVRDEGLL